MPVQQAVPVEDSGVLVVGPQGHGTTTLCAALVQLAASLACEHRVSMEPDGIRPLPLPMMLTATSMELLGLDLPEDCRLREYMYPASRFGDVDPVHLVRVDL